MPKVTTLKKLFLLGLNPPLIMPSILKLDFELCQLLRLHVIETRKVDSDDFASQLRFIECMERVNAAGFAELLMMRLGLEDIIGNRIRTREKFEVGGFGAHIPEANLPAIGAIASPRIGRQVEADFEFDCAADAASVILFERHRLIVRSSVNLIACKDKFEFV
jgi:hypothetical protein